MSFLDVDTFIEADTEQTITEIFKNGEEGFRDIESKAVEVLSENLLWLFQPVVE